MKCMEVFSGERDVVKYFPDTLNITAIVVGYELRHIIKSADILSPGCVYYNQNENSMEFCNLDAPYVTDQVSIFALNN